MSDEADNCCRAIATWLRCSLYPVHVECTAVDSEERSMSIIIVISIHLDLALTSSKSYYIIGLQDTLQSKRSANMDVDSASTSSAIAAIKAQLPSSPSSSLLQEQLDALNDTASRKLWHQLTNQLQALLANPESHPVQIELYDSFVKGLSKKLDQRRLVEIATTVAGQYEGGLPS